MNGGVNDFYMLSYLSYRFFGKRKPDKLVVVSVLEAFAYNHETLRIVFRLNRVYRSFLYGQIIGNIRNVFYHFRRIFGRHLRAVLAVNFVAVIFLRVVACGDHDSRKCVEISHRI